MDYDYNKQQYNDVDLSPVAEILSDKFDIFQRSNEIEKTQTPMYLNVFNK